MVNWQIPLSAFQCLVLISRWNHSLTAPGLVWESNHSYSLPRLDAHCLQPAGHRKCVSTSHACGLGVSPSPQGGVQWHRLILPLAPAPLQGLPVGDRTCWPSLGSRDEHSQVMRSQKDTRAWGPKLVRRAGRPGPKGQPGQRCSWWPAVPGA